MTSARDLASRDLAMAALMGVMPGADYGMDPLETAFGGVYDGGFGDTYGSVPYGGFGGHHHHARHHGYDSVSPYDISRNIGYSFGLAPELTALVGAHPSPHHPAHPMHPHPVPFHPGHHPAVNPGHMAAWNHVVRQAHETERREMLLNPNKHSQTKVERYSFTLTQALTLNTVLNGFSSTLQPNTMLRPQRVIMNAPAPNFCLLTGLFVANINVFVGGNEDAFTYSAGAQGVMLDCPTLEPANRATVNGNYTGLVPAGYAIGFAFTFTVTLQGPSSIAGGASV